MQTTRGAAGSGAGSLFSNASSTPQRTTQIFSRCVGSGPHQR